MAKHLELFASQYMTGKPRGYLIALAIICKGALEKGRLSDKIKEVVGTIGPRLLTINIERRQKSYSAFLARKSHPEPGDDTFQKSLKLLRAKDFRGFGSLGADDRGLLLEFNPGKNIFYAPNGGGKTSLCEAIEYVFTGGLKEAERRRTKLVDYIRRGTGKAIVRIKTADDTEFKGNISIASCFIDRNRLQEFSLLGSKDTNSAERDVLAALFGLEEIEEILSRFVQPKSFDLRLLKRTSASAERQALESKVKFERDQRDLGLSKIQDSRNSIAKILNIASYDKPLIENRLAFKHKLLGFKRERLAKKKFAEAPTCIDLRTATITLRKARRELSTYHELQRQILNSVNDIAFERLFKAVLNDPQADSSDCCPACLTPLELVAINPYLRADVELKKLSGLAELRSAILRKTKSLSVFFEEFKKRVDSTDKNISRGVSVTAGFVALKGELDIVLARAQDTVEKKIRTLGDVLALCEQHFLHIENYLSECNRVSTQRSGNAEAYKEHESIIEKLSSELEEITFLFRTMKVCRQEIKVAGCKIAEIGATLRNSKSAVQIESGFNQLVDEIQAQYKNLCDDLRAYKLHVEDRQVAGIESKATDFYQKINEGDDEAERITSLSFVRSDAGYRINIIPLMGEKQDAFSCLSEGHLRSLGLALLLAVAYKRQYPFIVFDDVVNAIDSDHRANIVKLMFTDDYLSSTQQIVTTHDRLFFERYCNAAKARFGGEFFQGRVLTCTNKGIVVVDYDAGFRRKVENALAVYDIRQALIYCRIWFETMVATYCTDRQLEITAGFSRRELKPNNYLEISLESTYKHIQKVVWWDSTNMDIIRSDLINWKGQNQEHHAFDEKNFNFVHSKTSNEVRNIFEAIVRFESQLFPEVTVVELEKEKLRIAASVERAAAQLGTQGFVEKAPPDVVARVRDRHNSLLEMLVPIDRDLAYAQQCLTRLAEPA